MLTRLILTIPVPNAKRIVQVGREQKAALLEVAQRVLGVWEELLVKRPAGPAVFHVPVHVQHEHIEWETAGLVVIHDCQGQRQQ